LRSCRPSAVPYCSSHRELDRNLAGYPVRLHRDGLAGNGNLTVLIWRFPRPRLPPAGDRGTPAHEQPAVPRHPGRPRRRGPRFLCYQWSVFEMTLFDPQAKLDWHAHVFDAGVGVVAGARYAPTRSATPEEFVDN